MKLSQALVTVATQEIGTKELGTSNTGVRVNEYKAATDLPPAKSWPWCAAFVCWCVREALKLTGIKESKGFKRPRTASAWGFEAWSLAQDATTHTKRLHRGDIQAGDIVVFTFSHIGIAIASPVDGMIKTIEGNTNSAGSREGGAVMKKLRRVEQVRCRIRFTV
jgi:hypothetical protein